MGEVSASEAACSRSIDGSIVVGTEIIGVVHCSLVLLHPAIEKGITLLALQLLVLECASVLFKLSRERVLSPSWMV